MKKTKDAWPYLIMLAKLGALTKEIDMSTSRFAELLASDVKISQQTASRKLNELKDAGLITKRPSIRGQYIRITKEGREELKKIHDILSDAFIMEGKTIDLRGRLFRGMGEGKHYISLKGYYEQFIEKLGFEKVFPGTLNLKLENDQDLEFRRLLQRKASHGILIHGFEDASRTYGPVTCFHATINDEVEGAVLVIQRTSWKEDVLEVISPHDLRKKLGLADGDVVKVTVYFD